ncbi:MAG: Asp-tRNA(Asn)/Glu-tRNA(Gln) amidotransferase subunit GatC [Planctomycetales bacterium]|nr:Asp-tRNA(Asn)/Glu-tRNA(Gln) amidotransferase subunit GatC [Planctomycetales bacterium]
MSLTREDIVKVSLLARLKLNDEELAKMTTQLSSIVDYVGQLSEIDTSGVEPMAHAVDVKNVFADDVVQASLPRDRALANAPNHDDECYRVPAVLGD